MRFQTAVTSVILLLFMSVPVHADWTVGLEGGTVIRDSGNATRLRLKASNLARPFSQYVYIDWLRNADGDNSYEAGYTPRYWFGEQVYGFGELRARVDRPLSIDNQQLLLAGVGVQLISSVERGLWAEAGVGKRNTRFIDDSEIDDSLGVVRGGFHQILADFIRFELDADIVSSETLTESSVETGIAIRVAGGSLKLSYRLRRVSPDGTETTETADSSVSFGYGF